MALRFVFSMAVLGLLLGTTAAQEKKQQSKPSVTGYSDTPYLPGGKWRVHDISRPKPQVVTPGATAGAPPSDAIVLFDGKDTSKWNLRKKGQHVSGGWKVADGHMEIIPGSGDLETKEKFGDIQLHIEWASPAKVEHDGQDRGNSGIILMSRYEVQVLDSYNSSTYSDGQAGSVYGQFPALVNATRKPGEWQTYDIVFQAPRFDGNKVAKPAYVTLFHNGVLVQNHQEFIGQMAHKIVRAYESHGPEAPLSLQDHNTPVRYRNIWIRKLNLNSNQ